MNNQICCCFTVIDLQNRHVSSAIAVHTKYTENTQNASQINILATWLLSVKIAWNLDAFMLLYNYVMQLTSLLIYNHRYDNTYMEYYCTKEHPVSIFLKWFPCSLVPIVTDNVLIHIVLELSMLFIKYKRL